MTKKTQNEPSQKNIEKHPFAPILPNHADIMMMGTFPPTEDKWAMPFHYPNFYNDMWRIYGKIFFNDIDHFRIGQEKRFDHHKIIEFLHERGIASCPTVRQVIREQGNASDNNLTIVEPVNLQETLAKLPKLTNIFTTGGKATEILLGLQDTPNKLPKTNQSIDYQYQQYHLTLTRLPSTSRAYPLSLEKKVDAYKQFFQKVGKL